MEYKFRYIKIKDEIANALLVFSQYGYQKTSLDLIANMTGISRQTLYRRYKSKKQLFTAALTSYLDSSVEEVEKTASEKSMTLHEKLLKIFEIWSGYNTFLMLRSPYATDIREAGKKDICSVYNIRYEKFFSILENVIKESGIKREGVETRDIAKIFYFLHKGIFKTSASHETFYKELDNSLNILCRTFTV